MAVVDLRLGDCLEIMRTMPDKSIDAVITDPPYGNETDYKDTYVDTQDNLRRLIDAFLPEARRIAKRIGITCGVYNIHLYPRPDWILCWHTPGGNKSSAWGFNCWQPILVYGKDPYLETGKGRRPDTFSWNLCDEKWGKYDHPCPKPVSVMQRIISRVSLDGTIFDPFAGSGTTGVACIRLNRNFIGCEINPDYFKIAQKRIEDAQRQMVMAFT